MIYGDILSFIAIFYAKNMFSFIKLRIYSIPNTCFLLARQQKFKKMVVSKEISDYFTKLVEPLVTTQRLEEMFGKLKRGNHRKI